MMNNKVKITINILIVSLGLLSLPFLKIIDSKVYACLGDGDCAGLGTGVCQQSNPGVEGSCPASGGATCGSPTGGTACPVGQTCINGTCQSGGGGGAGTTCTGCQPGSSGFSGLGQINNVWFTNQTGNSFTVNWSRDLGGCGNKSTNVIFIGTDRDVVNSNCFNCGSDLPIVPATFPSCGNKDYGSSNLPPGCLASRQLPINTTSFNTAGSVTLDPTKTYYVKVVGWLYFTRTLASGEEDETNTFCADYGSKAFLGTCTTSSVPPGAQISVGSPSQLFQTAISVSGNTISYSPIQTTYEFTHASGCDQDGQNCNPRDGLRVHGYYFGTGNIRLTINDSPVPGNTFFTLSGPICNDEGRNCHRDVNGMDVEIIPSGPGPVNVYINGIFFTTATGPSFHINCTSTTCPSASQITMDPYIAYDGLLTITNTPYSGGITSDSVYLPNFVWDFTSLNLSYSPGNGTSPSPFMSIASVGYEPSTDNPPYISIDTSSNPNPDLTEPFQVYVSALRSTYPGTTPLTTKVYATGVSDPPACTSSSPIVVGGAQNAWWQVKDSDVQANGNLSSEVPGSLYFGLDGGGGFPGVSAYLNPSNPVLSQTNLTTSNASSKGWLAKSGITNPRVFSYDSFFNQIPEDVTPTSVDSGNLVDQITSNGTEQYGYYWYKYDGASSGDLNLNSPLNVGTKKAILLVDNANFKINSDINLTDNQGFFMVIVNGSIIVDPAVGGGGPNLEGIYVADNAFNAGIAATQLWTRGSVVAYGGVDMSGRDLGGSNATTPALLFEYAPDQIMLFPSKLGVRKINWKEVAP